MQFCKKYPCFQITVAKEFWMEADVIKLGRDNDKEFRWNDDLGFSSSELSEPFLYYKEKLEIEVSYQSYYVSEYIYRFNYYH